MAISAAVSGALLLHLDSQLTFIADDWELLVARDGLSVATVFEPFHESIVVGPALVYKLLQSVFGMSSATPFYVVSISLFLTSAVLLFALLRVRVGDWLGLPGGVLDPLPGRRFRGPALGVPARLLRGDGGGAGDAARARPRRRARGLDRLRSSRCLDRLLQPRARLPGGRAGRSGPRPPSASATALDRPAAGGALRVLVAGLGA